MKSLTTLAAAAALGIASIASNSNTNNVVVVVEAKLADRSRVVKRRLQTGQIKSYHDNGRPIEGPKYRSGFDEPEELSFGGGSRKAAQQSGGARQERKRFTSSNGVPWTKATTTSAAAGDEGQLSSSASIAAGEQQLGDVTMLEESPMTFERHLSSQLSGCCYDYQKYSAMDLCYVYGNDCESGETPSHDSGDDSCAQDGLSFIGVSFSVNTANGNPYSYQLCDQFPMENIIDRDYKYVMSMDEDGWLVGGGYKTFDYSGKMP